MLNTILAIQVEPVLTTGVGVGAVVTYAVEGKF